jgi:hypothetical protein
MLIFRGIHFLVVWLCAATLVVSVLAPPGSVELLGVTLNPAAPTEAGPVEFSVWMGWLAQLRQVLALSSATGPMARSLQQRLSTDQWTPPADAQILLDFLVSLVSA